MSDAAKTIEVEKIESTTPHHRAIGVAKTLERLQPGEDRDATEKSQNFSGQCRIPVSPFVVIVKAGN